MSLVRAFTTRRSQGRPAKLSLPFIGRTASQSTPAPKPSIVRSQISAPVALISSTNVLSYESPDIAGTKPIVPSNLSSSSSIKSESTTGSSSAEDSDASRTSIHSNATLTDASSVDDSMPSTPTSPEPNHLSCYFKPNVSTSNSPKRSSSTSSANRITFDAPIIPQRAASHSKKAHVQLSRKRSVQRMSTSSMPHNITRDSVDIISGNLMTEPPTTHPFGKELEQLSEVAEDFSSVAWDAETEAENSYMEANGLLQFCATDYMMELEGLYSNVFEEDSAVYASAGWI